MRTPVLVHRRVVLASWLFNFFYVFVDEVGKGTVVVADLGEHEAKRDELLRIQFLHTPLVVADRRVLQHFRNHLTPRKPSNILTTRFFI